MLRVECEEPAVQPLAFFLQHTNGHFYACLPDNGNAAALNLGKGVNASHYYPSYPFPDYQFSAGWCLAVMGTGFQTDVHCSFLQQRLILRTHTGKGVHFSMPFAATYMIALSDNPSVSYNDSSHHGVGACSLNSVCCKL